MSRFVGSVASRYVVMTIPDANSNSITPSVGVKVVSCMDGRFLREGIFQFQWGDLNLRQVLI